MAITIRKKAKSVAIDCNPFPEIPDPLGYGQRAVEFLRSLKHPKSRLAGRGFQLDPWQEEIIRRIYGPCDEHGKLPSGRKSSRTRAGKPSPAC